MTDQRLCSVFVLLFLSFYMFTTNSQHKFASLALIQVSEAEAICSSLLKKHDIYSYTVSEHKTAFK